MTKVKAQLPLTDHGSYCYHYKLALGLPLRNGLSQGEFSGLAWKSLREEGCPCWEWEKVDMELPGLNSSK